LLVLGHDMKGSGPVEAYLLERTRETPICAALIDPEDFTSDQAAETTEEALRAGVGLILVGGSTSSDRERLDDVVRAAKEVTRHITKSHAKSQRHVPVVLFPGNVTGVSKYADAILFSSLLNSTNPYFIIGAQALGSMDVFRAGIESIPMGYLVFGRDSSTSHIGQVNALPTSKPNLAVIYALAAQYLGMRTLYLEGGSGASQPVSSELIQAVSKFYKGILIVGGGITSPEAANKAAQSGADVVVVGNLLQSPGHERTLKRIVASLQASNLDPPRRVSSSE
jgi:phosphoglycerol geranylgeranyltransferase